MAILPLLAHWLGYLRRRAASVIHMVIDDSLEQGPVQEHVCHVKNPLAVCM